MRSLKLIVGAVALVVVIGGVFLWWTGRLPQWTTSVRGQNPVSPGELKPAEYEVLSAYIAGQRIHKDIVKIVILNRTESGKDEPDPSSYDEDGHSVPWEKAVESLRKKAPALQGTTIAAFLEANAKPAILRRSLHPAVDYELVDSTELESAFSKKRDGWSEYYKRFPGSQGILTLSRVGFSADGTQALFYLANHCDGLCGTGMYVVMEKHNGSWVTEKEIQKWIS